MTQQGDYLRRLREIAQRIADESFTQSERALEIVRELDRFEEERDAYHDRMRSLRSIPGGAS